MADEGVSRLPGAAVRRRFQGSTIQITFGEGEGLLFDEPEGQARADSTVQGEGRIVHPALTELTLQEGLFKCFEACGAAEPKVGPGYILSKPAHSPPLYWVRNPLPFSP